VFLRISRSYEAQREALEKVGYGDSRV